jgi:hypothetical protein
MPPAHFALVIFEIESCFLSCLDCDLPILFISLSVRWQVYSSMPTFMSIEMESHKLSCQGWPQMAILPISGSQAGRIIFFLMFKKINMQIKQALGWTLGPTCQAEGYVGQCLGLWVHGIDASQLKGNPFVWKQLQGIFEGSLTLR